METTMRATVLPGGLRVLSETMPDVRSVAVGVWVATGTKDERPSDEGTSHFIEHMAFKGTSTRDAFRIVSDIESVGGYLNAYTGRDVTCFHARVLAPDLTRATDVLADILLRSIFDEREMEKEKEVVLEELRAVDDTPDDLVQEAFAQLLWEPHAIGHPILGTAEAIRRFSRERLLDQMARYYVAPNAVVAAAGAVDHDAFVADAARQFTFAASLPPAPAPPPGTSRRRVIVIEKPISQVHCCLGGIGPAFGDGNLFAASVTNTILGAGMSSRLFQRLREREALAYAVGSTLETLGQTGMVMAYLAAEPQDAPRALRALLAECDRLAAQRPSDEELASAKAQLKGSIVMGLEGVGGRVSRLAYQQIYRGAFDDVDETLARIEGVSAAEVRAIAAQLWDREALKLAVVAPPGAVDDVADVLG
jgi:predicted Zn-dependent peptidase